VEIILTGTILRLIVYVPLNHKDENFAFIALGSLVG